MGEPQRQGDSVEIDVGTPFDWHAAEVEALKKENDEYERKYVERKKSD